MNVFFIGKSIKRIYWIYMWLLVFWVFFYPPPLLSHKEVSLCFWRILWIPKGEITVEVSGQGRRQNCTIVAEIQ